ncbi:MAG: hypothetical protein AAFQ87_03175 [Bacteroidota bacterium]
MVESQSDTLRLDLSQYEYVPAICVVGYNRPDSFRRVLGALERSACPEGVQLIISIDRAEAGDPLNEEVVEIAEAFEWSRGPKQVIWQEQNVNLPDHILLCADMTEEYGAVLIIEDDLYLAPDFYRYALEATNFYKDEERVAGIGLYSCINNSFAHHLPFYPVPDGSAAYFLQVPCSWGQVWTRPQWRAFRSWWESKSGFRTEDRIPEQPKSWGDFAWDNHFMKYMTEQDKYFVWPYRAYSTNFMDAGTHFDGEGNQYQSPLQLGTVPLKFNPLDESHSRYDAYFELESHILDHYRPELRQYDYIVDLYGIKQLDLFSETYVLTQKKVQQPILSFSNKLKPFEMNLIENIPGNNIHLVRKEEVMEHEIREPGHLYDYYYSHIPIKALLRLLWRRVMKRLR